MQSKLECSFHSSRHPISESVLQVREKSIMQEYNRIIGNSQTPQYSLETIPYSNFPKFITPKIRSIYSECIYLDRFTFYEMFTMLIFQYLFKVPDQQKFKKINHLKALVYSAEFMDGSLFTKGLIIKGFKQLQELSNQSDFQYPLGQCLLNCDSICAFTECWKELIAKICEENNMPVIKESEIDSSIFQLFASFFHVKFDIYWKEKGNRLWKQSFTFKGATENSDLLAVIVNPDNQISVSQRSIKVSESRISGNSSSNNKMEGSWNYMILTTKIDRKLQKKPQEQLQKNLKTSNKPEQSNGEQISRISEREYSCGETEQFKLLLQDKVENPTTKKVGKLRRDAEDPLPNILNTMSKANLLIEEMRKYSEYLESLELPVFDFEKFQ